MNKNYVNLAKRGAEYRVQPYMLKLESKIMYKRLISECK